MLCANVGIKFEGNLKLKERIPSLWRFLNLCREMCQPNDCLRRMRLMCVGVIIR